MSLEEDCWNGGGIDIDSMVNDAVAQPAEDHYLTSGTCWVTGEPIWICKPGDGTCCVSCQGCCSATNPCAG